MWHLSLKLELIKLIKHFNKIISHKMIDTISTEIKLFNLVKEANLEL